MYARVEVAVKPEFADPQAHAFLRKVEIAHPELRRQIRWARWVEVYWLQVDCIREKMIHGIQEIFVDPVMKWLFTGGLIPSAGGKAGDIVDLLQASPHRPGVFWGLQKHYRGGVTDNVARTALEAMEIVLGETLKGAQASSGHMLILEGPELTEAGIATLAKGVFCNDLVESWSIHTEDELTKSGRFNQERIKREFPKVTLRGSDEVGTVSLEGLSDEALEDLSRSRLWALSVPEMRAIRDHFGTPEMKALRKASGLGEAITDVEIEVIAQTWSEHCKHKIFNAEMDYTGEPAWHGIEIGSIPAQVKSLFKETIKGTTKEIEREWLLSVFDDNAGIIAFDQEDAICIKVETHNSPSALDPYGGALTGIVGVNRDILGCGRGAKPIFNTDVFCVAQPDFSQSLPERILHPRRILDGVRLGVEHGGNKSGIPTVNGALVFDSRFLGKPLIYCGTGGIMPRMSSGIPCQEKRVLPGDMICMVGGRIGKDGIHGATFSSLALDKASPATAVQLGDPITQKRAADFLLEARDAGLYRTLTDNGAGGLSSSVGELATLSGGARMDVSKAATKYPGLRPYELVISESQERMTIVVPPENLAEFLKLAARRSVEVSVIGEFTESGAFEILYKDKKVAHLNLEFLHEGVPKMKLKAEWKNTFVVPGTIDLSFEKEGRAALQQLLGRPNIASKEWLIRQYDHEVQGSSVVKPLHTVGVGSAQAASGPNDGAVLKPKANSWAGIAVGCGINPKLSDIDPYLMAQSAVDEAIRNVLAVGAEFGEPESVLALVDNFCWPDPVSDPLKAAALVRACYGMRHAALALGTPFVSGKDSMKNDYRGRRDGQDVVISVPPTLLVTAVARVKDIRAARTSDFKTAGDVIYLIGGQKFGLLGSELHAMWVDRLRARGGNEKQVVLPWSSQSGGTNGSEMSVGVPDWDIARRTYRWLGGTDGETQFALRSVHDISEGGLLVALAESLIARGLGAQVEFSPHLNPWEFAFGEGFHSFVASVSSHDTRAIETEWYELGVPFLKLGAVTAGKNLDISRTDGTGAWSVPVSDLAAAWKKEGYWE